MSETLLSQLSRRERQIMTIIYQVGTATVATVLGQLSDPPSYSAVRATLRLLEEKGFLDHSQEGAKYIYRPTVARETASRSALQNVLNTFFNGSAHAVVATLIDDTKLSQEELGELSALIAKARQEGR